jgi:hypothetical protein
MATSVELWHKDCFCKYCYCFAKLVIIEMREGIFSFYIRSDQITIRAIALVENDSIRGFNRSHLYLVERLGFSHARLRKNQSTNWRVKVVEHTRAQGFLIGGFPAKLEGEEGEEQFCFEGGSDADRRVRVEIQGAWLHNLPWHRPKSQQQPSDTLPNEDVTKFNAKDSPTAKVQPFRVWHPPRMKTGLRNQLIGKKIELR